MRLSLVMTAILAIPVFLSAQSPTSGQSGRAFLRPSRMPATAASSPATATDAGVTVSVQPLRRLRSGRAWSRFHFSRTPTAVPTTIAAVDASAGAKPQPVRTRYWGRLLVRR
ncbi:MAG: hypothetical protein KDC98_19375 [Planctomycetes bacterium]|nr:hypothetical protein [Planctomycetota bacterium]